ncbi:Fungal specific transcription factor domain [Ceratobasidium sp. AG-Ba]|nr:Fungal specific transcription factor domain [Ceratobasidium sp. AG-Ba]
MAVSKESVTTKDHPTSPVSPERKPKGIRSKEGCLTCRIRRKKCDQGKHEHSCESCRRLHIECLGYSRNRPEWLKGAKVDIFKRMIKRFLAENSPKSGLHTRQDPSVPVPFLSFESLRGHNDVNHIPSVGPSGAQHNVGGSGMSDSMAMDDSDASDDEQPRHYQLMPLTKRDAPSVPSSEQAASANQSGKVESMEIDELAHDSESVPPEAPNSDVAQADEKPRGPSVAIDPTTGNSAENPEVLYYVSVPFPVLHELAGFNLSSQELLAFAYREEPIRNVVIAQAKHHQNRMRFLTSSEDPHHPSHRELLHELAASNNACINALAALRPSFESATTRNDTTALAVHYTLLHFGGLGDLVTRHSSRRGPQGAPGGNSSLLEISSRWLARIVASAGDLASALRRGGDRQRAIIQVAIHIDIFSSITLCRPPSLLDAYRAAFKNVDPTASADSNGVRVTVEPRLDDLLDIPAKTLLALAETAAMASWKAEHVRQGSLSVMDLSRWAKRIDALLVPPSPESLAPQNLSTSSVPHTKLIPVVAPSPAVSVRDAQTPNLPSSPAQITPITRPAALAPSPINPPGPSSSKPATPAVEASSVANVVVASEPRVSSTPISTPAVNDDNAARTSSPQAAPQAQSNIKSSTAALHNSSKPDGVVVAPAAPTAPSLVAPPVDPRVRPFRRMLPPATREVFRCGARVFLHSILSGERPRVHDIIQAVGDTCGALRELGLSYLPPGRKPTPADDLRFPVVRGLPFCIFIAGCMAGSMEQGMFLRSCLRPVVREVDMQTNELLTSVLGERAGSGEFCVGAW